MSRHELGKINGFDQLGKLKVREKDSGGKEKKKSPLNRHQVIKLRLQEANRRNLMLRDRKI